MVVALCSLIYFILFLVEFTCFLPAVFGSDPDLAAIQPLVPIPPGSVRLRLFLSDAGFKMNQSSVGHTHKF